MVPAALPLPDPGTSHSVSAGWLCADRPGRSRPPQCRGTVTTDLA